MNGLLTLSNFMPHGQCYLWLRELLLLHVVSDGLIVLAYYSIPLALIYFLHHRPDVQYRWLAGLFALFILACGTTHLLSIWTVWEPDYWLSGMVKAVTAAVSVSTAIMLWVVMPAALRIPSAELLRQANTELQQEVAQHRQTTAGLEESEARFRGAFDFAAIGMALVAPDGRFMKANRVLTEMLGYSEQQLQGLDFQTLTHPDDLAAGLEHLRRLVEGDEFSYQTEKRYIHRQGHVIWVQLAVSLVADTEGQPRYFVTLIQNISRRKAAEQALLQSQQLLEQRVEERTQALAIANRRLAESNHTLQRLALYDELTGLYNRRHLMQQLEQAFKSAHRYDLPLSVIMMDLDYFKQINDTHGHAAGDRVLAAVGQLIGENIRASDIAGRYGGEEFCIALTHTGANAARCTAEKLRQALVQQSIDIEGEKPLHVTTSMGLASWQSGQTSVGELLHQADQALYRAKRSGRNQVCIHIPERSESGSEGVI